MNLNPSELNDLASVDIMFAEMMAESGVNPIPSVCDGCDMSIFDQDNKTVSNAFVRAEENMKALIGALDKSMTIDNKESISRMIDNLIEKEQVIADAKQNFGKEDFDFVELYTNLKKIQNKLGLNLNCPEMNVLSLADENFNLDAATEKVVIAAMNLDNFIKEGEQNFNQFLTEGNILDEDKISEKMKQKIQEVRRRKEMQRENQIRLNNRVRPKFSPTANAEQVVESLQPPSQPSSQPSANNPSIER